MSMNRRYMSIFTLIFDFKQVQSSVYSRLIVYFFPL